ncbi:MAG: hypothetical protein KJ852_17950 [Gammaproteobacteria bacterium]|nr:hypothetical protein [Gammaproteobacteria bacterium]MBU0785485.1 hypothetical protein [Gammaproteobacteria bacterium]MBU0813685.1 hypothetical protein [Gammaproteobacteria bacterium]MBU1788843.1 hypothetical protein [Gammaproteobacteria bacterium]
MSKTIELNANIAALAEELSFAKEDHAKSVDALINNPRDVEARAAVRVTEHRCNDLETDLKHLNQALLAARQYDESDEAKAIKLKGLAHLASAENMVVKRNAAAAAMDDALRVLTEAAKAWADASNSLKAESVGFYRIAFQGNPHATLTRIIDIGGLEKAIANTVLAHLDDALSGLNLGAQVAISYTRDVHAPEPCAEDDSRKSGKNLIEAMRHFAEVRGLRTDPETRRGSRTKKATVA